MYWIWATEAADENDARIVGRPDVIDRLNLTFDRGAKVGVVVPVIEIRIRESAQGRLTDNLIALGTTGLVFNARLRGLLRELGIDNIDYYDAVVVNEKTGAVNHDYQVANIVGTVNCVDHARSELVLRDDGSIKFIDKLVLDEPAASGMLMFRLAEYRQIVVIHDVVKGRLDEAAITGVKTYQPEEYVL